jgi:hypothetical protein
MPSSRFLIASNTLGSSAASVTFSSIPATYTDLVLKVSARSDVAATSEQIRIRLNSTSSDTNLSATAIGGTGSAAYSDVATNGRAGHMPAANATSSTFSSGEIYIPSYTASQNKQFSAGGAIENNSTTYQQSWWAVLWRDTSAITSIYLFGNDGGNFVSGSTFWLYGLKNS